MKKKSLTGLGLRQEHVEDFLSSPIPIDFLEVAPENWMCVGGKLEKKFKQLRERYTFICHGLSLSLGGFKALDKKFLKELKQFLNTHKIKYYSEHLSYCADEGQLYDLLPIPFTEEAVKHVAKRIRQTQDYLERSIAIENVSYYLTPPISDMSEIDFLLAVLEEADCKLLLDVNNIYVNSINQKYNAEDFLSKIPKERIAYLHIAGHYQKKKNLLIDTHGADIVDPVWNLLKKTYQHFGIQPTLLERDFNLPSLSELLKEVEKIGGIQNDFKKSSL